MLRILSRLSLILALGLPLTALAGEAEEEMAPAPAPATPAAPAVKAPPDPAIDYPTKPVKPGPRDWPATPGAASLCLWKGDRMAAYSLTIDDNCAGNHAWWVEQGERFGLRCTWFIITGRVAKEGDGGFNGSWEGYRKLVALGHDVQSHTVSHLNDEVDVEIEYRESKAQIETNLPGHRALVLAYPGGKRSIRNDPQKAKPLYLGARGVVGFVTPAIGMPYLRTGSQGGGFFDGARSTLESFLDPKHRNYRGWHISLFHLVQDKDKERIIAGLTRIKDNAADIWPGLFREVILYARERDAAKLEAGTASATEASFTLTDTLDDALFDYPLTVKVRLDPAWTTCQARQQDKAIPCAIIEHEGARFALVDAVPDRGVVTLKP